MSGSKTGNYIKNTGQMKKRTRMENENSKSIYEKSGVLRGTQCPANTSAILKQTT